KGALGKLATAEIDPHGSGGDAEHRDADYQEGEVVPENGRENAGLNDLKHQARGGDQEDTAIKPSRFHRPIRDIRTENARLHEWQRAGNTVKKFLRSLAPVATPQQGRHRREDGAEVEKCPEKLVQSIRTVRGVVTETEFGRASWSWTSCTIPAQLPACGDPARDLARGIINNRKLSLLWLDRGFYQPPHGRAVWIYRSSSRSTMRSRRCLPSMWRWSRRWIG